MSWRTNNELLDIPPAPKFSLLKVRKQQEIIRSWLIEDMAVIGEVFQDMHLKDLRRRILKGIRCPDPQECFSDSERVQMAVDGYLPYLIGHEIDKEFVERVSLQLVEWMPRFEDAEEYLPWNQETPVWALVRTLDIERKLSKESRHYTCRFQAIAGLPAGMYWDTHMSGGQIQQLLRSIGLPKYSKYRDDEIGGLYLITYLRPSSRRIEIGEVTASSSVLTFNKKVYKERQGKCIGGFWNGKCINCPWSMEDCQLARHQNRYEEKIRCENYRIADGKRKYHRGFKIKRDQGVCLDCLNKGHIRQEALKAFYQKRSKFKAGKSLLGGKSE